MDHLAQMPPATLIYLDPARRDEHGARTYATEDCTPNALALRGQLLDKAPFVMIKLSPMLDWRKTIADFVGSVAQVHITATGNECKEIVVVLARGEHERVRVVCVNDAQRLEFEVRGGFRGVMAARGCAGCVRAGRAAVPVRTERGDHEGGRVRRDHAQL